VCLYYQVYYFYLLVSIPLLNYLHQTGHRGSAALPPPPPAGRVNAARGATNSPRYTLSTMGLLGVREAARRLGVHENTLRRWEQSGLIHAVKLPTGVRRFREEDVDRLYREMHRAVEGAGDDGPTSPA
jgi:excisionase family DNA binding protein